MKTLNEVDKRLIAAIHDENTYFDMRDFVRHYSAEKQPATCGTASCMSGHLVALYPEVAAKLLPEHQFESGHIDHEQLANAVYEQVAGEECRIDFFGWNIEKQLKDITRDEAVLHIAGLSNEWPLCGNAEHSK